MNGIPDMEWCFKATDYKVARQTAGGGNVVMVGESYKFCYLQARPATAPLPVHPSESCECEAAHISCFQQVAHCSTHLSFDTYLNCITCKYSIFTLRAPLALFSFLSYFLFDCYPFGLCANFLIFRFQDIRFVIHYIIPSLDIRLLRHAKF